MRRWIRGPGRACAIGVQAAICLAYALGAQAASPYLYSDPAYESPVRGEPDDLLLLAGNGLSATDVVAYRAIDDTTAALSSPQSNPQWAEVVSTKGVPHSLTVKLPKTLRADQSYALWVRNRRGEWSNGLLINDARPFWITPAYTYATQTVASLPRSLKVVGRNLQRAPGETTKVRLTGPQTLTLDAIDDPGDSQTLAHYVARVSLPAKLAVGRYSIGVSRDGTSWVDVSEQEFVVRPDEPAAREFRPNAFGGCRADDGADDTPCVARALEAARTAGGGTVVFGPGRWDLYDNSAPAAGTLLPLHVNLKGAGAEETTLAKHPRATGNPAPLFVLLGDNTIEGIAFRDLKVYSPTDRASPLLQLGRSLGHNDAKDTATPRTIEDVVITRNVFDKPFSAIGDGGVPVKRLFITFNTIGAYRIGIAMSGSRYNTQRRYSIEDSVVAFNTFAPGSYLRPDILQGSFASELGAALRVDFSNNRADGTVRDYLYSSDAASGWRAGFFWTLADNQEMALVSQNEVTCPGDRIGDGEAFAFDNNGNTFAFASARTVVAATADSVTVEGPLAARQSGRDVNLADYYSSHWIQIAQGPGLGQSRQIASYRIDASSSRVTFTVSPRWEVVPARRVSRLSVGRQFWQVYAVDNVVDQRKPLCSKGNRSAPKGGGISLWAQMSHVAIEGNRQFDTDGIVMQQAYSAKDTACPACTSWAILQSFLDIRRNVIDGEYDWGASCSHSGIQISLAAAPTPGSPPPVAGFGVSISHNTVKEADGLSGGGIGAALTWHPGPPPHRWDLIDGTLIHHNTIVNPPRSRPPRACAQGRSARSGIDLERAPLARGTVLYGNVCANVASPLRGGGSDTVRVCPASGAGSCECAR